MEKQAETLQSLDLNNQQIQSYQPQTKSIEDIFPKELKELLEIKHKLTVLCLSRICIYPKNLYY